MASLEYRFWISETFGLIRQEQSPGHFELPEIWCNGCWKRGNEYVMDAVTGMGEDPYSCGEFAAEIDLSDAKNFAAAHDIDLFANPQPTDKTKRRLTRPMSKLESNAQNSLRTRIKNLRKLREEKKAATGRPKRKRLSSKEREEILRFTDSKCHICGGDIQGRWQADHVRAHSAGGQHSLNNYLPAHSTCNNYRWDYLPEEMQLILRIGVWTKTQIERGTVVGRTVEKAFTAHEEKKFLRRSKSKLKE